jgi:hypothetical protein
MSKVKITEKKEEFAGDSTSIKNQTTIGKFIWDTISPLEDLKVTYIEWVTLELGPLVYKTYFTFRRWNSAVNFFLFFLILGFYTVQNWVANFILNKYGSGYILTEITS